MKKVILPVILIVLIALAFFVLPRFIKIRNINCISQFGPCSVALSKKLSEIPTGSYFDIKKSLDKSLKSEVRILKYSTRFVFPDKLVVNLIEKKAVVAIGKQGIEGKALIDKSGQIIGIEDEVLLPVVSLSENEPFEFNVGSYINDDMKFVVDLTRQIFNSYQAKLVILKIDSLEIKINTGHTVIFPRTGDIDLLLGSLNLILSRLNNDSENSRIEIIDLRFKNPVIK